MNTASSPALTFPVRPQAHDLFSALTERSPYRAVPRNPNDVALVIEDDDDVSRLIATKLRYDGMRVVTSQDGEDGIRLALSHRPDIIVLDLLLPSIDGFGVLHFLSTLPSMRRIPIIVLTALSGETAESAAREWHNVQRFVRKPVDTRDISKIVGEVLSRRNLE